jgi:hypothetical protein
MTVPQVAGHPCLAGIEAQDLKWWRGDNYVTAREPQRPTAGTYRPIVVSGNAQGLAHAPLLELPRGRGTILLCQMRLVEKCATEPTARRLWQNCLDYLAAYGTSLRPLAALGLPQESLAALEAMGYLAQPLTELPPPAEAGRYAAVLTGGPCTAVAANLPATRAFLEAGGTLYCHKPAPEVAARLVELGGAKLTVQPNGSPVRRVDPTDRLTRSLTREDLYWMGELVGSGWSTRPLATTVADFGLGRALDEATAKTYEAEEMEVAGAYHNNIADGIVMASGDCTARFAADFGPGGEFAFGASAGGSGLEGVFPALSISVDDRLIGHLQTRQEAFALYVTAGPVAAGKHEVVVRFTNDRQIIGVGDRNLTLDKVLIAPAPPLPEQIKLLTQPAALAQIQVGRGTLVVDYVNWDVERPNRGRAFRYASALLTELGADYQQLPGVTFECEDFTPQPGMAHYSGGGGRANLASSGWIEGEVPCAREGDYIMEIVAGGSEVDKVFPIVDVELDGQKIGTVELRSEGPESYRLPVHFTQGDHKLRLVFTNDEYRPPEDRNLWVDKVFVRGK